MGTDNFFYNIMPIQGLYFILWGRLNALHERLPAHLARLTLCSLNPRLEEAIRWRTS